MRISDWSSDVCSSDLPDEVDRHIVDLGLEMPETVDRAELRVPVVPVAPVGHQFPQISAIDSLGPVVIGEIFGKARAGEPFAKIGKPCLGRLEAELLARHPRLASTARGEW